MSGGSDLRLAVIGLGNIGGGVASNLVAAGHHVTVADLDATKVESLVAQGAGAASSASDAVANADVVFTSLPGPKQIAAIAEEIVPLMRRGSTWVELSTNDLDTARAIGERCAAAGVDILDAPVSGGPEGAAAGTLSIFVGGKAAAVQRIRPLLEAVGTKIDHLGPHGAGIVAKIAQVTLCYTQTVTLIEALILGAKGGVEPAKMLDLIRHSAGTSYAADVYGPEILAGTYDASFPLSHAAKDLRLAMELADTLGLDLPFTADVSRLYAEAEATFGSTAAHCLAAQLIERTNGLVLHEVA
ncbi:MAG: NAD(P)-dependent oxidoreductase [Actinomycetota bacterium]